MKNKTQSESAQNPKPFHFTDRAKPTNIADKNVSNKFSGLLIALNKNNKPRKPKKTRYILIRPNLESTNIEPSKQKNSATSKAKYFLSEICKLNKYET